MSRYLTQRALCHPALPVSRKSVRHQSIRLSSDEESFYERLGESADTRVEPGINQDEVFDDQFERRAHEIQRTPSADNAVTVISAKQGPWTGNNNLGVERPFGPDDNNLQTILRLPEWGFPQVWSVMLDMKYTDTDFTDFDVIARVEAGSGGGIETFEVDWNTGTSFSVVMNAMNLVALYSNTTDLPTDLRLTARIGRFPLYGQAPTRTFPVLQSTQGNFELFVPRYAKAVDFLSVISGAGVDIFDIGVEIRFLGNPGNLASTKAFITGPNLLTRYQGRMILPGGTNAIAIFNPSLVAPLACTAVFEIAL